MKQNSRYSVLVLRKETLEGAVQQVNKKRKNTQQSSLFTYKHDIQLLHLLYYVMELKIKDNK